METYFLLGIFLFILATVTLISGTYLYRIKLSSGTKELAILCFAVTLYCVGFALELASTNFNQKEIFNTIKYLAVPFFAPLWLVFIRGLFKIETKSKLRCNILIFSIPVICLVLRLTNNLHGLYYTAVTVGQNPSFQLLDFTSGPVVTVFGIYNGIIFTTIVVLVVIEIIKNKKNRRHSGIMLGTILVQLIFGILARFHSLEFAVMIMPFLLPASVVFIFLELFKFNLFNIVPLSHTKVFEWSKNGILVLDNDLKLTDYNSAMQQIFPQITHTSYGTKLDAFIAESKNVENSIINSKEYRISIQKDYGVVHYNITGTVIQDKKNQKTGYMVTFANITRIVDTMDELTYLANTDSLTGLYTRRTFTENAERELSRAKRHGLPLTCIMLDIDHFKNTNDTFGHIAGDIVLKGIAKICRKSLRDIDLLGRFGGEEFIILLPETDMEGGVIAAERIREIVQNHTFVFEDKHIEANVSLGVVGTDKVTVEELDTFIKNADKAMYAAKAGGRNRVEFSADTLEVTD